jgi:hypothetical protein
VAMLFAERPQDWHGMGRDLVRLLMDAGGPSVPELQNAWQTLKQPAKKGHPATLLEHILSCPTPREYLQCRVTPIMETHLMFLMTQVVFL